MSFSTRRENLFNKSKRVFPDPVAWLLAITYEPRIDGRIYERDFVRLLDEQQDYVRGEIQKLNASQGGRVEKLLTEAAKILVNYAEENDLSEEAELLNSALNRCRNAGRQDTEKRAPSFPKIEPERVLGRTGKPIGLWR